MWKQMVQVRVMLPWRNLDMTAAWHTKTEKVTFPRPDHEQLGHSTDIAIHLKFDLE